MTPHTATEQAALKAARARFAAYGDGLPIDALVTAREAYAEGLSKAMEWHDGSVLVRVEPLIDWVATLDLDTAYRLVEDDEVLMGWFQSDLYDDEDADDDGDFMSTPSVSGDRDDEEDIPDALRHCSREGFISVG